MAALGQVIGHGHCQEHDSQDRYERNVTVDQEAAGDGQAGQLVDVAVDEARRGHQHRSEREHVQVREPDTVENLEVEAGQAQRQHGRGQHRRGARAQHRGQGQVDQDQPGGVVDRNRHQLARERRAGEVQPVMKDHFAQRQHVEDGGARMVEADARVVTREQGERFRVLDQQAVGRKIAEFEVDGPDGAAVAGHEDQRQQQHKRKRLPPWQREGRGRGDARRDRRIVRNCHYQIFILLKTNAGRWRMIIMITCHLRGA